MKPHEVCAVLGITYSELCRLVQSGEMPALRIGYLAVVRERDLEEYIARQLPEPAAVTS